MKDSILHQRNFLLHIQERPGYERPILVKEAANENPLPSSISQLHNEFVITTHLEGLTGVRPAYELERTESKPAVILEYIPGKTLAELLQSTSLEMEEKLQLALNLSIVLGRIHDREVMHKDISSHNILITDESWKSAQHGVLFIDFGLASMVRQENPARLTPGDFLHGTLAYISPEQSGRMNRQIDYRTDLYSLGVVFYELFTGRLPFESNDVLELIHAHIARQPLAPDQIDVSIPAPLSDIILKLLSKNAEDRYQTASGLQTDLEHCLEEWRTHQRVEPFRLAKEDFTGRLQIPQKLYGREAEIGQLQTVLERAISGSPEFLLVAGYSGVGKTALVNELQKDAIKHKAVFLEGKFDQLQQILPYSGWAQALTQLVNSWLSESETQLAGWRKNILEAVGDQGQLLIDIIPALEKVIGPQPEVPHLGGLESQNRFNYTFNRFISNLATEEHPLVIFLDDLQWIDPASLNLIQSLLTVQNNTNLLVIGAYRDNEVGPDHPLRVSQEKMHQEGKQLTILTLKDLTPAETDQMLSGSLHLDVADCTELSQALLDKTAGNPFFYRQQLYALESEGLLTFDRQQQRWVWAENLQQSLRTGENVVDLMIRKIHTLPAQTQ